MKRRDLLRKIAKASKSQRIEWVKDRNGANHDVYSLDGIMIPIPRHNEIGDLFALDIFKE